MKKVKIMLTAIVVLAVVGGALAFKANKSRQRFCFYQKTANTNQTGLCEIRSLINTDFLNLSTVTAGASTVPYATTLATLTNTTTDVTIACPALNAQDCDVKLTLVEE